MTPAPQAHSSQSPATSAGAPSAPAPILLVDDDPGICGALQRVLSLEGWNVATAFSGEQALRMIQASEPALIITDLCMARVNGWDVLFHEKLQRPRLPIFVITALPRNTTGGADKFATEFFQKPIDIEALIAAVRRHLPH